MQRGPVALRILVVLPGLCIGSVGFSKLKLSGVHPLRVYAALEAGIAVCGFLVLVGLPLLDRIYISFHFLLSIVSQATVRTTATHIFYLEDNFYNTESYLDRI